jgi:predicted AAA+ superfamily ATPase
MRRKIERVFEKWKQDGTRKPMLVYGARQVGKSYSVREFGLKNYQTLIEVDFERDSSVQAVFNTDLDPPSIIRSLEKLYNKQIDPEKTLVFFDEIQRCPRALTALKYFAEDTERGQSHYQIIAAGSLLGVLTQHIREDTLETIAFPVGKVEEVITYPLDFEEFMWASGQEWLSEQIRKHYLELTPMDETLHQQALKTYYDFLVVGGMPEVVVCYLARDNFDQTQRSIIANYAADMIKYRNDKLQSLRDIDVYNSIPAQLSRENKKFLYSGVKKSAKSRDYYASVLWLKDARIAIRCFKTKVGNLPPKSSEDQDFFKLYLSDTGLLCHQLQVTLRNLNIYDQSYQGAVTENYVACALQNKIRSLIHELHYWKASEKTESAEVDFLIATNEGSIPIEVKSGLRVRSQSLNVFIKKYSPQYAIRLSEKNFGWQNNIKSIPLYAAFCIEDML